MWSVVLKILSILGIVLLILLGIALAAVLLVLFMPVVYRGAGSARAGEYRGCFRFRWLFGLVRGEFTYPEGGALRIKALWITIYDSGRKQLDTGADEDRGQVSEAVTDPEAELVKDGAAPQDEAKTADAAETSQDAVKTADVTAVPQGATKTADAAASPQDGVEKTDSVKALLNRAKPTPDRTETPEQNPEPEPAEGLSAKLSSLKKKLQPYLAIVRDEDNQAVVRHVLGRLGRILKGIRPRVLRLEALFGLGEPDKTGYVYGACWAVKPFLGRKCRIAITPDFERQILEGEIFLRGHIMGVVLLYHIIRVILDKRLWQLIDQLKRIQE